MFDAGVNIEANLRGIAERRTDIFGVGIEEAEIGKKVSFYVVWQRHQLVSIVSLYYA